jgi:hypothetical protein
MRLLLIVVAVVFVIWLVATSAHGSTTHRRVSGHGQVRFDGHGPEWWAREWRREHQTTLALRRRLVKQRRILLQRPSVVDAINLSCATYGSCSTLWRKARCESQLNTSARNLSSAASGLFQFMPSTFASTPYRRFSIFDAYANALAAGWMHAHGRGGEWACR